MKLKGTGFFQWYGPEQVLSTIVSEAKFVRESQFAYDVAQPHFQRLGDAQKDINCRHPEAAFNLSHVNGIDINSFSELFLSQSGDFPIFTDAIAEMFSVFFCDHSWLTSQSGKSKTSQILLAIIFHLCSSANALKEESE